MESLHLYLLQHSDLASRFPNWSSTLNLTQIVHELLREEEVATLGCFGWMAGW